MKTDLQSHPTKLDSTHILLQLYEDISEKISYKVFFWVSWFFWEFIMSLTRNSVKDSMGLSLKYET